MRCGPWGTSRACVLQTQGMAEARRRAGIPVRVIWREVHETRGDAGGRNSHGPRAVAGRERCARPRPPLSLPHNVLVADDALRLRPPGQQQASPHVRIHREQRLQRRGPARPHASRCDDAKRVRGDGGGPKHGPPAGAHPQARCARVHGVSQGQEQMRGRGECLARERACSCFFGRAPLCSLWTAPPPGPARPQAPCRRCQLSGTPCVFEKPEKKPQVLSNGGIE